VRNRSFSKRLSATTYIITIRFAFIPGPLISTVCVTDVSTPVQYWPNQTAEAILSHPKSVYGTRCPILELNPNETFGIKIQKQLNPSCLTISEVVAMQVKGFREMGLNSSIIAEIDRWHGSKGDEALPDKQDWEFGGNLLDDMSEEVGDCGGSLVVNLSMISFSLIYSLDVMVVNTFVFLSGLLKT
jgi:hypothetical protein